MVTEPIFIHAVANQERKGIRERAVALGTQLIRVSRGDIIGPSVIISQHPTDDAPSAWKGKVVKSQGAEVRVTVLLNGHCHQLGLAYSRETWLYPTNTLSATVAFLLLPDTNLLPQAGITHYSQLLTQQHSTKLLVFFIFIF